MLKLCSEIHNNPSMYEIYSRTFSDIVDWYTKVHEDFSSKLQKASQEDENEKYKVEYEILAKEKLLYNIEILIKFALSKFSYGPTQEFFNNNGFIAPPVQIRSSWSDVRLDFAILSELLAHTLEKNNIEYNFDLKVLASDREQRNQNVHKGLRVKCMTLIRKYESTRNLLIFLDADNNTLPHFQENSCFEYDDFISEPCNFSFKETTTVLIADRKCNKDTFKQLEKDSIETLKQLYEQISPLSIEEKKMKNKNFDHDVINDIRTPFIIGLYYLEKDFQIDSYVQKVLNSNLLPLQQDMIALLAFCDIYDSKTLPSSFINRLLGYNLKARTSLILTCPDAESLICRGINEERLEEYYFKHKLLSSRYLEGYIKNHKSNLNRFELAKKFIEYASNCQGSKEKKYVLDTLITILIKNKDGDINNLSQLLNDIAIPETQRALISYLAEKFKPSADSILSKGYFSESDQDNAIDMVILKLVAHAYAHLGKLYSMPPENYAKAAENFALAEKYMPYEDSVIYHMHGKVLYRQLYNEWNLLPVPSNHSPNVYENIIDTAIELFNKTSEFGDAGYGITGQLRLLYEYLKYVYKINNIHTNDDLCNLTAKQREYQTLLIDILDEAEQYDFDDTAQAEIDQIKYQLKSNILMGDFGKSIEHYNNEYEKYKKNNDTELALVALQSLVSAKIQKAKDEYRLSEKKNKSFYMMISNPNSLFLEIATLLSQLYNRRDRHSYLKRTSLFRHWFQLAKLLNCPINDALIQARLWVESEDEIRGKKNPEPYYYQSMLLYITSIDGENREIELNCALSNIANMNFSQQFDIKHGRVDRIKDILIDGTGMSRLLDVSDCVLSSDIANRILSNKKAPCTLSGNVNSISYSGAKISISEPSNLRNQIISCAVGRMSKNTLDEGNGQVNHKVKFFAGFTTLGMRAVSDSLKDQTSGENFSLEQILVDMSETGEPTNIPQKQSSKTDICLNKTISAQYISTPTMNTKNKGDRKIFHPKYIMFSRNGLNEPLYLNGDVDDGIGGVSIKYLTEIFGNDTIEAYGGIQSILNNLIYDVDGMDMIVEDCKTDENNTNKYTLILYNENIELSQLLQLQKESEKPSQNTSLPIQNEEITLPDFNGKQVQFIPNDLTLAKTQGKFSVNGIEYNGVLTNVKTPKERKKAKNFNGNIPAIITGKPQSGKYSLKMR